MSLPVPKGTHLVLFTPGESNFEGYDGYLANVTMSGRFAQENSGAAVVIEVRPRRSRPSLPV